MTRGVRRHYALKCHRPNDPMIEGSSFAGLFTSVEIGHMRAGSAGCGRDLTRVITGRARGHVRNFGRNEMNSRHCANQENRRQ